MENIIIIAITICLVIAFSLKIKEIEDKKRKDKFWQDLYCDDDCYRCGNKDICPSYKEMKHNG